MGYAGSGVYHFCSHSTATPKYMAHPTAREAGKCHPAVCPGRRGNDFNNQLGPTATVK